MLIVAMMHLRRGVALSSRAVCLVSQQQQRQISSSVLASGAGNPVQTSRARLASLWRVDRFSCCAKVDLPPPREIVVEYEEKAENTDFFIELADGIENSNPDLMVLGNPDDMQPRDGSFEVTSGEKVLFSRLQAKRLPRVEEILLALEQLPTEALSCELETNDKAATA